MQNQPYAHGLWLNQTESAKDGQEPNVPGAQEDATNPFAGRYYFERVDESSHKDRHDLDSANDVQERSSAIQNVTNQTQGRTSTTTAEQQAAESSAAGRVEKVTTPSRGFPFQSRDELLQQYQARKDSGGQPEGVRKAYRAGDHSGEGGGGKGPQARRWRFPPTGPPGLAKVSADPAARQPRQPAPPVAASQPPAPPGVPTTQMEPIQDAVVRHILTTNFAAGAAASTAVALRPAAAGRAPAPEERASNARPLPSPPPAQSLSPFPAHPQTGEVGAGDGSGLGSSLPGLLLNAADEIDDEMAIDELIGPVRPMDDLVSPDRDRGHAEELMGSVSDCSHVDESMAGGWEHGQAEEASGPGPTPPRPAAPSEDLAAAALRGKAETRPASAPAAGPVLRGAARVLALVVGMAVLMRVLLWCSRHAAATASATSIASGPLQQGTHRSAKAVPHISGPALESPRHSASAAEGQGGSVANMCEAQCREYWQAQLRRAQEQWLMRGEQVSAEAQPMVATMDAQEQWLMRGEQVSAEAQPMVATMDACLPAGAAAEPAPGALVGSACLACLPAGSALLRSPREAPQGGGGSFEEPCASGAERWQAEAERCRVELEAHVASVERAGGDWEGCGAGGEWEGCGAGGSEAAGSTQEEAEEELQRALDDLQAARDAADVCEAARAALVQTLVVDQTTNEVRVVQVEGAAAAAEWAAGEASQALLAHLEGRLAALQQAQAQCEADRAAAPPPPADPRCPSAPRPAAAPPPTPDHLATEVLRHQLAAAQAQLEVQSEELARLWARGQGAREAGEREGARRRPQGVTGAVESILLVALGGCLWQAVCNALERQGAGAAPHGRAALLHRLVRLLPPRWGARLAGGVPSAPVLYADEGTIPPKAGYPGEGSPQALGEGRRDALGSPTHHLWSRSSSVASSLDSSMMSEQSSLLTSVSRAGVQPPHQHPRAPCTAAPVSPPASTHEMAGSAEALYARLAERAHALQKLAGHAPPSLQDRRKVDEEQRKVREWAEAVEAEMESLQHLGGLRDRPLPPSPPSAPRGDTTPDSPLASAAARAAAPDATTVPLQLHASRPGRAARISVSLAAGGAGQPQGRSAHRPRGGPAPTATHRTLSSDHLPLTAAPPPTTPLQRNQWAGPHNPHSGSG